jgi:hypothetical protein
MEAGGRTFPLSGDSLDVPRASGAYPLLEGTRRAGVLVVNAEREESDLARLSGEEFRAAIGGGGVRIETEAPAWSALAWRVGGGTPVGGTLALGALLLLGIESLLLLGRTRAASGERK